MNGMTNEGTASRWARYNEWTTSPQVNGEKGDGKPSPYEDAATVVWADAIVSWNFKHIVRNDKMRAYNQVILQTAFGLLSIVSPQEVRFDEAT